MMRLRDRHGRFLTTGRTLPMSRRRSSSSSPSSKSSDGDETSSEDSGEGPKEEDEDNATDAGIARFDGDASGDSDASDASESSESSESNDDSDPSYEDSIHDSDGSDNSSDEYHAETPPAAPRPVRGSRGRGRLPKRGGLGGRGHERMTAGAPVAQLPDPPVRGSGRPRKWGELRGRGHERRTAGVPMAQLPDASVRGSGRPRGPPRERPTESVRGWTTGRPYYHKPPAAEAGLPIPNPVLPLALLEDREIVVLWQKLLADAMDYYADLINPGNTMASNLPENLNAWQTFVPLWRFTDTVAEIKKLVPGEQKQDIHEHARMLCQLVWRHFLRDFEDVDMGKLLEGLKEEAKENDGA